MANRKTSQKPVKPPLAALGDVPRLVIIPGLETPSGGPVLARVTGHARRPVLTALVSFACLAGQRVERNAT